MDGKYFYLGFHILHFKQINIKFTRGLFWKHVSLTQRVHVIFFQYCFQTDLYVYGGLEPVASHTEKLCIASYCFQFSINIV